MFSNSKFVRVYINEGVTSIGDYAFAYCSTMNHLTLPQSLTSIVYYAFYYCSVDNTITISENVTHIGELAFGGLFACNHLVVNCKTINANQFKSCDISEVTIGENVTTIGEKAFSSCSMKKLTIGSNVTEIGEEAFWFISECEEIYCKPTTPPQTPSDIILSAPCLSKLYVPRASLATYQNAEYWNIWSDCMVAYDF